MKKIISFLFILSLSFSNICYSQSGWFFQNPLPANSTIRSADFINSNTGYMVGDCNLIIKTTNGGVTWIQQNPNYFNYLRTVQFIDINTGFASGNYSILKTTNSGENWFQIYTGVRNMYFVDYNIGYAEDWNYILVKTTNGGNNWSTVNTLTSDYDLYFINELTGFGGGPNVIKTTNGGINWISYTGTGLGLSDFFFVNNNTGFTVGANGNILKTSDSGLNWQAQGSGTGNALSSVSFINENTGFVVGSNTLLKTTNGGNTWSSYNLGNYLLFSIYFSNLNTGYTAGYGGYIFKTTDTGNTWNMLNLGTRNALRSVYFPSNSIVGFCTGDQGLILNTTNGGDNWNVQNSGTTLNLNSLFFLDDYSGYIACDTGKILKTVNGGLNWDIQNTGITYNLYGIYFFNTNSGFVSGGGGSLFKTTNAGMNWNSVPTGVTSSLNSIYFFNQSTGFVTGGNRVLKTTNGCNSWNIQYLNTSASCNFKSIYFLSPLTGYVAGHIQENQFPYNIVGIVIKTTDGGDSWNTQIGFWQGINSIKFTNSNIGYITTGVERMYTTNGGTNWIFLNCASGINTFNSFYFIGEDTGYVVGENGVIMKTIDAGGIYTTINNYLNNTLFFSLSQNYPNPFNPVTRIKYQIPLSRGVSAGRGVLVRLIIYDILGREIETIVNDTQKPGSYEVTWDGSRYASGVYFYRLYVDDASAPLSITKKMVLIK